MRDPNSWVPLATRNQEPIFAIILVFQYDEVCKFEYRLRNIISCSCCFHISHTAFKADCPGSSETSTGSEFSQLKFKFTGLNMILNRAQLGFSTNF